MKIVENPSMASPTLKMISVSRSQNTSDTSFIKYCEKDGANKPVHDEEDYSIASHHRSMILVLSHLVQEYGRTTMVASPALKIIDTLHSQNTYNKN